MVQAYIISLPTGGADGSDRMVQHHHCVDTQQAKKKNTQEHANNPNGHVTVKCWIANDAHATPSKLAALSATVQSILCYTLHTTSNGSFFASGHCSLPDCPSLAASMSGPDQAQPSGTARADQKRRGLYLLPARSRATLPGGM